MSHKAIRCLSVGAFLICMLFYIAGCGHGVTSLEVIEQMNRSLAEKEQIAMDLELDLGVSMEDTDGVMKEIHSLLSADVVNDRKEERQKASVHVTLEGTTEPVDLESQVITYTDEKKTKVLKLVEDHWVIQETEKNASPEQTLLNEIMELKDILILESDTTEAEGKECYVLKTLMVPEDLKSLLEVGIDLLALSDASYGTDIVSRMLDPAAMDDVKVMLKLYVDVETGLPVLACVEQEERKSDAEETEETEAEEPDTFSWEPSCELKQVSLRAKFTYPENGAVQIPEDVITQEEFEAEKKEEAERANVTVLAEYDAFTHKVLDNDSVKVYLRRVEINSITDAMTLQFQINNYTRKDLEVFSECLAVNGQMIDNDSNLYCSLKGCGSELVELTVADLKKKGIDRIGTVSMLLTADDMSDLSVIFDGEVVNCILDETVSAAAADEAAELVYEDENIAVWAMEPAETDSRIDIPVFIENRSEASYSVDVVSAVDQNGSVCNVALKGVILPSCILSETLTIEKSKLDRISEYLNVTLRGADMDSLVTLFTTEAFPIYTGGEPMETLLEKGSILIGEREDPEKTGVTETEEETVLSQETEEAEDTEETVGTGNPESETLTEVSE